MNTIRLFHTEDPETPGLVHCDICTEFQVDDGNGNMLPVKATMDLYYEVSDILAKDVLKADNLYPVLKVEYQGEKKFYALEFGANPIEWKEIPDPEE